ncbi:hypothetical protein COB55_05530 [Candidatus Wolfebacteria bacterium]|nr:MAG: hypothetical protein COB55_05530 [Candidatus Wolfebacteria bacterium]
MVIHSEDGTESIIRSRSDSQGIDLLYDAGLYDKPNYETTSHEIDIVIMSRETNKVVKSVANKIKMKCTHSLYNKTEAFKEEVEKRNLKMEEVIFMGNDLNDVECMKQSGIGIAVSDSYPQVLEIADYITEHGGGKGAFRGIVELIIESRT